MAVLGPGQTRPANSVGRDFPAIQSRGDGAAAPMNWTKVVGARYLQLYALREATAIATDLN